MSSGDPTRERPASAAEHTTGSSVLRGGLWQLVSRFLPQIYTLILSIALARYLGPDDFGRQSFIAFVAISATTLFGGGLKVALMRTVGELFGRGELGQARVIAGWTMSAQAVGALLGGAALAAWGLAGADPEAAWILAGTWVLLSTLQTVPNAVLLGGQQFRSTATIGLVGDTVALPTTLVVLATGGGIVGVFAVEAVVAAGNLIWTSALARRLIPRQIADGSHPDRSQRARFVRFAGFSTASAILTLIVWHRSELFFLEAYSSDAQIGIYSIAFATVAGLILIPGAIATVLAPAFATLFGAGHQERLRSGFARGTRLLVMVALPITAATVALGPELLEVVYGSDFSGAGDVLLILMAVFPLLPIYEMGGALLIGFGRGLAPLLIGAAAAAVSVGLDFLLIPAWDAVGAAAANSGAQLVVVIATLAYVRRMLDGIHLGLGSLSRAAFASVCAGVLAYTGVVWIGGLAGVVAGGCAGAVLITLISIRLGVLSSEDADWIEQMVGPRFGARIGRVCRPVTIRSSGAG